MFGPDSPSGGRDPEVSDEELLNVIRNSDENEVTTKEIAEDESITISLDGVRPRLKKLESEGRVRSRDIGGVSVWELGEIEPKEPVHDERIVKARKTSNFIRSFGKSFLMVSLGFFGASVFSFMLFTHSVAGEVEPPFLSSQQLLATGYLLGFGGAFALIMGSILYAVAGFLPSLAEWIAATETEED